MKYGCYVISVFVVDAYALPSPQPPTSPVACSSASEEKGMAGILDGSLKFDIAPLATTRVTETPERRKLVA